MIFKVDSPAGTVWRGATYIHDLQLIVWTKVTPQCHLKGVSFPPLLASHTHTHAHTFPPSQNGVAYLYDFPQEVNLLPSVSFPRSMAREPTELAFGGGSLFVAKEPGTSH